MIINRVGSMGLSGGAIAKQVEASADDGYWYSGDSSFSNSSTVLNYGAYGYSKLFARWIGITIPGKPAILSASVQVYVADTMGAVTVRIYFNNVAAPTSPTSYATAIAKALTTAYVTWTIPATVGWQTSPDISAVIQEIVDAHGPFSNGAMMMIFSPSASDGDVNSIRAFDYSGNLHGPKLNISW